MKKLSNKELIEEVEWLMAGGMSPAYICETLNVKAQSIARMAERKGLTKIANAFSEEWGYSRKEKNVNREEI